MENKILEHFYAKVKETEDDCGYPIQMLHVDIISEIFEKTVSEKFQSFYKEKNEQELIDSLLLIKDKWLGDHLVGRLMQMMDTWENVDSLYEHEILRDYY